MLLWLVGFGLVAALNRDKSIVVEDGRPVSLAQRPAFSLSSWFSGEYPKEYEAYYNDQFPGRGALTSLNRTMNAFYTYSSGKDSMVVIGGYQSSQGAGERLDTVAGRAQSGQRQHQPQHDAGRHAGRQPRIPTRTTSPQIPTPRTQPTPRLTPRPAPLTPRTPAHDGAGHPVGESV